MVTEIALVTTSAALGALLGWGVLVLVGKPGLLAEPNDRSSHDAPTPTMGGIPLVVIVLAYFGYTAFALDGLASGYWLASLAGIAAIGLWDDLNESGRLLRIFVHFVAAVVLLFGLDLHVSVAWWVFVVIVVGLVWLLNLYNFMDGIDGIAAVQCLVFCLGAQIVGQNIPGWAGELLWCLSGATIAFLFFNWPPAKIFMGDVGSGFLGLLIGGVCLHLWQENSLPLVASIILLAAFWFDATYTLCVRIASGQEFTQAHRRHLYQKLTQRKGHLWTTGLFLTFASLWLIPLAWASVAFPAIQWLLLFAAVLPIGVGCVIFRAGLE